MKYNILKSTLCIALIFNTFSCASEEVASQEEQQEEENVPQSKQEAAEHSLSGKADLPFDLCKRNGWYDDDECDWFCADHDPVCHAEPLGQAPSGEAARYPVVLMHGFNAGREGMWAFYRVEEALIDDGHTVYMAEVPAFASTQDRAEALAVQIDELLLHTGAPKVNLVAHSMGGLDARYLISGLGYGDRVASLSTISTPHRGSAVADVGMRLIPGAAEDIINGLATLWSATYNDFDSDADVKAALNSLSSREVESFNALYPNARGVYYQSWAGVSSVWGFNNSRDNEACEGMFLHHVGQSDVMNKQLVPMAAVLAPGASLTPNDGMVTVESAKWGEFKGCIPADHLDEVGQPLRERADKHTGFDHVRFYRNLVFELAQEGF